jgi:hypothetical protein
MKSSGNFKVMAIGTLGLALSACATENYTSEMYQPNFGRNALRGDVVVDPQELQNGMYAPRFSTSTCLTAGYRCGQQWSAFDP